MNTFGIIIASIGGSAALFAVVGWLSRSIISQLLSKDIEAFKSKLQYDSQLELTKFKSELERSAFEHQVRFSQLHEKRADIIADLFGVIVDLHSSVDNFILFLPAATADDSDKNLKSLHNAVDKFKLTFEKNRIYFNKETCELIDSFNESMSKPVSELVMHIDISGYQNWDVLGKVWMAAQEKLYAEIEDIKEELEMEFRQLLGVLKP